ncbi:helix-turn-helix domain-containing protein [Aphanothece sacrum]
MYRAVKVRIYPTPEQSQKLSQVMGAARWCRSWEPGLLLREGK